MEMITAAAAQQEAVQQQQIQTHGSFAPFQYLSTHFEVQFHRFSSKLLFFWIFESNIVQKKNKNDWLDVYGMLCENPISDPPIYPDLFQNIKGSSLGHATQNL